MSITTDYPTSSSSRVTTRVADHGVTGQLRTSRPIRAARSSATIERRRYVGAALPQGRVDAYGDTCVDSRESDQNISWTASIVGVLATAVVILGMVGLANLSAGSVQTPVSTGVAVVQQGETISEVAQRVAPGEPVQSVVDRLLELNALDSAFVTPGQELVTPSVAAE